ncbi:MAG: benzoyl-CoA-dihydrodiol lyase [Chromatiales bacterium]|nr:benzoyl-CoA-dihydrodiol lyase [Chromatiales bacterium]
MIDFQTDAGEYKHWRIDVNGAVATLTLDVDEDGGLFEGYELKMNSYDLGVDIELSDAIQRLRFEHPAVGCVVIRSAKERIFCAGANIRMLGSSSHALKVNFCKFTNETRNAMEDASEHSGQQYMSAINGTAAGGGYELALATNHILLVDDGSASVSLPEVPLLGVLPGTGGLTRVVDKRHVRRDHADVFCTLEEGIRGKRAQAWRLVDELAPSSQFEAAVDARAQALANQSDRPATTSGISLTPLDRVISEDMVRYPHLNVELDRNLRTATLRIHGPGALGCPTTVDVVSRAGAEFWPLALARALDDAILHLRANEQEIGTLVFTSKGDASAVSRYSRFLVDHQEHWLVREIVLYWKRLLKRIDVTSRTLVTQVEPGSCFAGFLSELLLVADRSYMLDGQFEGDNTPPSSVTLDAMNFGPLVMCNGLTRLATRFLGDPQALERLPTDIPLDAEQALEAGLVTFTPDDIDWEDELRLLFEERAAFSPDAMIGMEANLRFPGPETVETKIFGRLSAWQNWIFQRPNAVGDGGALTLYGSGSRPRFNRTRV